MFPHRVQIRSFGSVVCRAPPIESSNFYIMGELCRIVRHLESGIGQFNSAIGGGVVAGEALA